MLFTRLITDESIKVLDGNAVDDILLKARISVLTTFSQKILQHDVAFGYICLQNKPATTMGRIHKISNTQIQKKK